MITSIWLRLRQGIAGLRPTPPPNLEQSQACLNEPARAAFSRLSIYDQTHLCAVHDVLVRQGETDNDVLTAALLHDLGKAALGGRVRLIDRTFNVLLAAIAPGVHRHLTVLPAPRCRLGLALAARHPELGADWARDLGCNERVCWLIAHHADAPIPPDDGLQRLVDADRRA